MRVFDSIIDGAVYAAAFLRQAVVWVFDFLMGVLRNIYEKFLEVGLWEKVIFLAIVPAFFAVVLPVARFYAFERWWYINNPLAVYLIAIIIIMVLSLYVRYAALLIGRGVVNLYYLFWIIYLPASGQLARLNPSDPHEIAVGFYLNIAVPVVFAAASALSYLFDTN